MSESEREGSASPVESWPLLPAQAWFFSKKFKRPEQYCIAVIFETVGKLVTSVLHQAIALAVDHHDSFRTQFRRHAAGWEQFAIQMDDATPILTHHDLSSLSRDRQDARIRMIGGAMVEQFAFGKGRLARVATIDLGPERGMRLLLIGHHLVCDLVSLSILMQDIDTAYRWLLDSTRDAPEWPPILQTTTARAWSTWLNGAEAGAEAMHDAEYWERPRAPMVLPLEAPNGSGRRESVSCPMPQRVTTALVHRTDLFALSLAALGRVIADWCGTSHVIIGLTSPGRTPAPPGVNLSRTTGWLVRYAPVYLDIPANACSWSTIDAVDAIVAALDERPRDGFGYSVLRFTANRTLASNPSAVQADVDVSFDYVGNGDTRYRHLSIFREATENTGFYYSSENSPAQPLGLQCGIKDNVVVTRWTFDASVLSRATVEALARRFEEVLASIRLSD